MSCFHPLKAFYRLDGDKKILHFVSAKNDKFQQYDDNGNFYPYEIDIPCGQCAGCRLDYSRQWATRCMLESSFHEFNWFVTLTYDDEHLPFNECYNCDDNGEIVDLFMRPTLRKKHVTQFIKNLRRYMEYHYNHTGIRFYACGEYGDKNGRPHYHLILFNCPIPDIKAFQNKSHSGALLFESDILSQCWDNKGLIAIGELTFQSAAYTARYMMKKQKGRNADYYDKQGQEPVFSNMSRRPGIAKEYFDKNFDKIYSIDKIVIVDYKGKVLSVKPPRYFDRLYDLDNDPLSRFHLNLIKYNRMKVAKKRRLKVLSKTSLNAEQYLAVEENNQLQKIKCLTRMQ